MGQDETHWDWSRWFAPPAQRQSSGGGRPLRPFSPAGPEHILIRPPSNDMKVQGKGEEHLNITQRPRRGATEHPQRTHRGPAEGSHRVPRGPADNSQKSSHRVSQRSRRGPIDNQRRIHTGLAEGFTETSQTIGRGHAEDSQSTRRICRGPTEDS